MESRPKPTALTANPLLSIEDLATRWQKSRMSIWRMRHSKVIPSLRIGANVRFKLEDVLRFEADAAQ